MVQRCKYKGQRFPIFSTTEHFPDRFLSSIATLQPTTSIGSPSSAASNPGKQSNQQRRMVAGHIPRRWIRLDSHQDARLSRCYSLELCSTRLYSPTSWFSLPAVHREAYGNVSSNHICLTNYPPNLLSPHNHRVQAISVANTDNHVFQGVTSDPTTFAGSRFSQVDLPTSGIPRLYHSFASLTLN